jgi:glycosyltransferase involved in cell wall biosynthesis
MGRGPNPLTDLRAFLALWRLIGRARPAVVHAFDTKPGVYGCLAARLAGVPAVVGTVPGLGSLYVGNGPVRRVLRGVYERLQWLASRAADVTVFQNREDADEFLARGVVSPDKDRLIPGSGVRTDLLDPAILSGRQRREARAALNVPPDAVLVTMVSRVIRSKGVTEFAAAAEEVRRRHPEAHFLLVGPADANSVDGFKPAELTQITGAVNWAGPRRDVPRVLAASDLFVLPSFYREGIPRALLEAASMALPLITTDSPGCNQVVEDGVNGFLVPVRDAAALGQAIVRLVAGPELRRRFGQVSRRRAVERFDLSVIAAQTRALYRELLARRAPASAAKT